VFLCLLNLSTDSDAIVDHSPVLLMHWFVWVSGMTITPGRTETMWVYRVIVVWLRDCLGRIVLCCVRLLLSCPDTRDREIAVGVDEAITGLH
jgi:hypothetical protein